MKNKKYFNLKGILFISFLFLLNSCSLDITPKDDDDFTSEQFFSNPASYKQYLAKIYAGLAVTGQQGPAGQSDLGSGAGTVDEGFSQYLRGYWQLQELPTDEAIIAWGDPTLKDLNLNTWNADNVFTEAFFARIFFQIGLCNEFLRETTDDKLNGRNVDSALRAQIQTYRAEVRFMRALSYYHGIDIFGKLPFGTESDPLGTPPPMQSRTFVFNYILDELNAIDADLLAPKTNEYGRADRAAAWMLKAKLLMNANVYTGVDRSADALTAVNAVIGSGYGINGNYTDLFKADNNSNGAQNEVIFPVCFDGVKTQTWGGTTFLMHGSTTDAVATTLGVSGGWGGFRVRKEFTQTVGTDLRVNYVPGNTDPASIVDYTLFAQGKKITKFSNKKSDGTNGQSTTFPDTDFPLFRMGDAYLMYAELATVNNQGSVATALTYINALRSRAGVGPVSLTDITTDPATFILKERAKELHWEGHRRQDLIRLGKYLSAYNWEWKGGNQAGNSVDSHVLIYPIPNKELRSNTLLSQNPGY